MMNALSERSNEASMEIVKEIPPRDRGDKTLERVLLAVGVVFTLIAVTLVIGAELGLIYDDVLHLYSYALVAASIGISLISYSVFLTYSGRAGRAETDTCLWKHDRYQVALGVATLCALLTIGLILSAETGLFNYDRLLLYSFAIVTGSLSLSLAALGLLPWMKARCSPHAEIHDLLSVFKDTSFSRPDLELPPKRFFVKDTQFGKKLGITIDSTKKYTDDLLPQHSDYYVQHLRKKGFHPERIFLSFGLHFKDAHLDPSQRRYQKLKDNEFLIELLTPRSHPLQEEEQFYCFLIRLDGELLCTHPMKKENVTALTHFLQQMRYMPHELMCYFTATFNQLPEAAEKLQFDEFLMVKEESGSVIFYIKTLVGTLQTAPLLPPVVCVDFVEDSDLPLTNSFTLLDLLERYSYKNATLFKFFGKHFKELGIDPESPLYLPIRGKEVLSFFSPSREEGFFVLWSEKHLSTPWLAKKQYLQLHSLLTDLLYELPLGENWGRFEGKLQQEEFSWLDEGEFTFTLVDEELLPVCCYVIICKVAEQLFCSRRFTKWQVKLHREELTRLGYYYQAEIPKEFSEDFSHIEGGKEAERWAAIPNERYLVHQFGFSDIYHIILRINDTLYCTRQVQANQVNALINRLEVWGCLPHHLKIEEYFARNPTAGGITPSKNKWISFNIGDKYYLKQEIAPQKIFYSKPLTQDELEELIGQIERWYRLFGNHFEAIGIPKPSYDLEISVLVKSYSLRPDISNQRFYAIIYDSDVYCTSFLPIRDMRRLQVALQQLSYRRC